MLCWIILVITNFGRIAIDLWTNCPVPSAVLTISPPYDINSNIHMLLFYFLSWFPAGFFFHYALYARGIFFIIFYYFFYFFVLIFFCDFFYDFLMIIL